MYIIKTHTMPTKAKSVKDEILFHLDKIERPLAWLSRKSDIKYGTLYSILVHKISELTDKNLDKINRVLGTNFINN